MFPLALLMRRLVLFFAGISSPWALGPLVLGRFLGSLGLGIAADLFANSPKRYLIKTIFNSENPAVDYDRFSNKT